MELSGDGVDVVDTASPDAAAGVNECGPQASVVREIGVWGEVGTESTLGKKLGGDFRAHRAVCRADEVDCAGQILAVDEDLDLVTVLQLADGTSGESFGRDVTDAGSGGDAAETRVSEDGDVFAERKSLQC